MIRPEELRKKFLRPWATGAFLGGWLSGDDPFPITVPLAPPSGRTLSRKFADVRDWIRAIEKDARPNRPRGYAIVYREVNDRRLGPQRLPRLAVFASREAWLGYIGKQAAFDRFGEMAGETRRILPELVPFMARRPLDVLAHQADWSRLLQVCDWFRRHPRPGLYLRQIDIPGVDTKFIESRKRILTPLLDRVLAPGAVDGQAVGLAGHGFERRFGLRHDPPLVRLRLLDPELAVNGLTDLTLPAADAAAADFGARTVFVTENKTNGLAFPPVPGALVIFGLGYGIEMLADFPWMKPAEVYYWGDIDTHGFAILSRMRGYFPRTRSLLMDEAVLLAHRRLWGTEAESRRFTGRLPNLTAEEAALYAGLRDHKWGQRLRLEQEHVGYSHLVERLQTLGGEKGARTGPVAGRPAT